MGAIRNGFLGLVGLGLLIQLVPYGRDHGNPPELQEPPWDRPRTRELFFRACKDCHSNQTEWPWYSSVAPASWLVQRDVEEGRSHFDVSEWGRAKNHGDEAAEKAREGEMPPWFYLPLHPEARLSDEESKELVAGLVATFGEEKADDAHEHHRHEH
jgi:mono/diheme cytochrome c family protein